MNRADTPAIINASAVRRILLSGFLLAALLALDARAQAASPAQDVAQPNVEERTLEDPPDAKADNEEEQPAAEEAAQDPPPPGERASEGVAEQPATPPKPTDAAKKADKAAKEDDLVCYQERTLGSSMLKRVCRRKADIEATERAAKRAMRDMRRTTGSDQGN
jgi:hypothetical protein